MTEQDKQEVKQMILVELRQRGLDNIGVATATAGMPNQYGVTFPAINAVAGCNHNWKRIDATVPYFQCQICFERC